MDVVLIKKTEPQEKTILRLDVTNDGLGTCTISQILNATPTFRANTTWLDGHVVSIGELKEWANEHSEDYDAYIFNGKKEQELKDYGEESPEE